MVARRRWSRHDIGRSNHEPKGAGDIRLHTPRIYEHNPARHKTQEGKCRGGGGAAPAGGHPPLADDHRGNTRVLLALAERRCALHRRQQCRRCEAHREDLNTRNARGAGIAEPEADEDWKAWCPLGAAVQVCGGWVGEGSICVDATLCLLVAGFSVLGLHALRGGAARLMIVLPASRLLCDRGVAAASVHTRVRHRSLVVSCV